MMNGRKICENYLYILLKYNVLPPMFILVALEFQRPKHISHHSEQSIFV